MMKQHIEYGNINNLTAFNRLIRSTLSVGVLVVVINSGVGYTQMIYLYFALLLAGFYLGITALMGWDPFCKERHGPPEDHHISAVMTNKAASFHSGQEPANDSEYHQHQPGNTPP